MNTTTVIERTNTRGLKRIVFTLPKRIEETEDMILNGYPACRNKIL